MPTPRSIAAATTLVLLLLGAACGGGADDGSSTDVASDDTDTPSATTTTEEQTVTTAAAQARTDIKPCELLTTAELEAQASVANVTTFKVTRQDAKGPDGRGAFRCDHYFTVIEEKDGGRSEVTATLAVEIRPKDAAAEYKKLHDFGERDRQDITNLGDKAFYDVENGSITILDDDLVVIVDPGMPGSIAETNRPVAEAVAPIVLGRL